jgi:hypothetical protein
MPVYLYQNPKTGEVVEIFQKINEEHKYIDKNGTEHKRVFTVPFVSFDSRINPHSSADFVEKTKNKKGTIGDLLDKSKELSIARGGESSDPVLKKYFSKYEKEKGVKHSAEIRKEKRKKSKEKLKKIGISVS